MFVPVGNSLLKYIMLVYSQVGISTADSMASRQEYTTADNMASRPEYTTADSMASRPEYTTADSMASRPEYTTADNITNCQAKHNEHPDPSVV